LSLAQKSGDAHLISGDKDLLRIKKIASLNILSPRQFWEIVKRQKEAQNSAKILSSVTCSDFPGM